VELRRELVGDEDGLEMIAALRKEAGMSTKRSNRARMRRR
jgi:hypothetical protein